jgi:hypothetical protein
VGEKVSKLLKILDRKNDVQNDKEKVKSIHAGGSTKGEEAGRGTDR